MRKVLNVFLSLSLFAAPLLAQNRGRQSAVQDDQSDRPKIDVESYSVDVTLTPDEHRLVGKADIRFKQLDRQNYAVFDLDRRLRVDKATMGGSDVRVRPID